MEPDPPASVLLTPSVAALEWPNKFTRHKELE
jgi:hypothetical protein